MASLASHAQSGPDYCEYNISVDHTEDYVRGDDKSQKC